MNILIAALTRIVGAIKWDGSLRTIGVWYFDDDFYEVREGYHVDWLQDHLGDDWQEDYAGTGPAKEEITDKFFKDYPKAVRISHAENNVSLQGWTVNQIEEVLLNYLDRRKSVRGLEYIYFDVMKGGKSGMINLPDFLDMGMKAADFESLHL